MHSRVATRRKGAVFHGGVVDCSMSDIQPDRPVQGKPWMIERMQVDLKVLKEWLA